ncbi:popeye domain-containing protein 3-like isoform X3 [Tachypleus tridentatus]|uniref:popeye domain-containing protein 3-like isoform X3 n=1 Tax=Tachypleus tridentatus TaxID=6853 RepID=UPI003FD3024F
MIKLYERSQVTMRNVKEDQTLTCSSWQQTQHVMFQLANLCFCLSYLAPNTRRGILIMHVLLIFGFLMFSTWSWNTLCAPDIFLWNFMFMLLNMGHVLYILYKMHPVLFTEELEAIYRNMFLPFKISRQLFRKLVDTQYAQVISLRPGDTYATQNLTRTDRLGLVITGKMCVMKDKYLLHYIYPQHFMDSPEFESSKAGKDDKFKVSVVAVDPTRYIVWRRQDLDLLFVKETHLSTVFSLLLARDIAYKLYAMNERLVTQEGSKVDIRFPTFNTPVTSRAVSRACNSLRRNPNNHKSVFNCPEPPNRKIKDLMDP